MQKVNLDFFISFIPKYFTFIQMAPIKKFHNIKSQGLGKFDA